MSNLSYYERDYAARLEKYIADEAYSRALYAELAGRSSGNMAVTLRAMSADEGRHLKAMQMEYYLLTGDSCPMEKTKAAGDMCEAMRKAYAGEGEAAEGYAREAEMHSEGALKALFLAQCEDEKRHRANVKKMLGTALGM